MPTVTTFAQQGVFLPEHGVSISMDDTHETRFTIDLEDGRWLKVRSHIGDDACWHEHPSTKVTLGQVLAAVAHDKQALDHVLTAHLAAHKAMGSTRGTAIANRALKPHGLRIAS